MLSITQEVAEGSHAPSAVSAGFGASFSIGGVTTGSESGAVESVHAAAATKAHIASVLAEPDKTDAVPEIKRPITNPRTTLKRSDFPAPKRETRRRMTA